MDGRIRINALFATLACLTLVVAAACGGDDDGPTSPSPNVIYSQTDLRVGTGAEAVAGRTVTVNYTGWIYDANAPDNKGRQFDTSLQPGRSPLPVVVGGGGVITGFDRALVGMRVGGLRRVVIPPELGYGPTGSQGGAVPPNTAIVFEIELLTVS